MTATDKTETHSQHNNFDFLRILAAIMVLFAHQFALMRQDAPVFFPVGFGELGVAIFFSISGFLVVKSWINDPHIFRFIARRFLRIWPALIVVTCLAALILGPLVTKLTWSEYFHARETWSYFTTLRLNIQFQLPGVFLTNPYPAAVDGSLWSIPLEVKWYWILLIGGVLRVLKYKWLILAIFVALGVYQFGIYHAETNPEPNYSREYGLYFTYGVCLYLFHSYWIQKKMLGFVGVVVATCALVADHHPTIALLCALPYCVIMFGTLSTPVINRFGRFGDLSYGIYIYAFPVQQTIIWLNHGQYSLPVCMALSLTCTVFFAFISWYVIEKPAMRCKPKARPAKIKANASSLAAIL
jgi:peptidoglycan/LPS O-acetylase OafA/YrhL